MVIYLKNEQITWNNGECRKNGNQNDQKYSETNWNSVILMYLCKKHILYAHLVQFITDYRDYGEVNVAT